MKKILLGLIALAFMFVVVACNGDDLTEPEVVRPTPGTDTTEDNGGGGEVALPGDIEALLAEWNLPAPRFTPDPNTPSWQLDQAYDASIVWYVNYIWWPAHNMGDSWVTTVMMGDLNVRIEFISGEMENLNTMVAGGTLPDIITLGGYNVAFVADAPEFAIPLDVLATVYDPYFLEHVHHPQTRAWFTLADGHMYGIPNESMTTDEINAGYALPGAGFLVRQDIFEAIGEPDMSTPEGFLDALRAARDYMPQDSVGRPLTAFSGASMDMTTGNNGSFSWNIQDFLAIPVTHPDGTWYDRDADPDYLAWMLVFRQAMEEGLMSPDQFSDDNESINDKFQTGHYFAFMAHNTNDVASRLNNINTDAPERMMIPISGPRNAAGDAHTFPAGGINGWTHTFVTQNTNDPQTAMQVITYFTSDHGQMIQQFGHEGVTYEYVNGIPTLLPEMQEFLTSDYYGFRLEYGLRTFWMLRRPGFFASRGVMPTGPHADVAIFNSQFNQARLEFVNLEPTEGALQRDNDDLDLARSQAIFNLLTASSDEAATAIWEDFLASRDQFGFDAITAYRNERLRANRERLGLN